MHLNGRVYDPLLARMTSADPTVTDPLNPQGWNRYSYVGNDPLAFTDPSGFSWLSSFFRGVVRAFRDIPILRAVVQIVATVTLTPLIGAIAAAAAGAAIVNGLSGGRLSDVIRSAAIAGFTAFAFFGVGELTGHTPTFGTSAYAANVAGHAAVGCGAAVASGGECGPGALSGAIGAAATPLADKIFPNAHTDFGQRVGAMTLVAVAGGGASVAGGGKFANGAVTAAFGYLFNADRFKEKDPHDIKVKQILPADPFARTLLDAIIGGRDAIAAPISNDHHIFPRQFEGWFSSSERDIKIDDYTVTLDRTMHLQGVHGAGLGGSPGRWNSEWAKFIQNNPTASRLEVFQQAGQMMDWYGINNYPIHPFGKR